MDTQPKPDREVMADRIFLVKPGEWSKKGRKYTFPNAMAAELVNTGKAHFVAAKTATDADAIDPAAAGEKK